MEDLGFTPCSKVCHPGSSVLSREPCSESIAEASLPWATSVVSSVSTYVSFRLCSPLAFFGVIHSQPVFGSNHSIILQAFMFVVHEFWTGLTAFSCNKKHLRDILQ